MCKYEKRLKDASKILTEIISSKKYNFNDLVPSVLPKKAGVYIIMHNDTNRVLYVGRTKNIQQRLYNNHLMGNKSTARLKKYLVEDKNFSNIINYKDAKCFLKNNCSFQFILIKNSKERGQIEGLLAFLTDVHYIEKEH